MKSSEFDNASNSYNYHAMQNFSTVQCLCFDPETITIYVCLYLQYVKYEEISFKAFIRKYFK